MPSFVAETPRLRSSAKIKRFILAVEAMMQCAMTPLAQLFPPKSTIGRGDGRFEIQKSTLLLLDEGLTGRNAGILKRQPTGLH